MLGGIFNTGASTPHSGAATPQSTTDASSEHADSADASNRHRDLISMVMPRPQRRKKIVVAMTGATGAILGIKVLIALRRLQVETHLVISKWAGETIKYETDYHPTTVRALADHVYNINDMAAPIASGSFRADGMIVVPCSMKSLAAMAMGFGEDLISRSADVMLKERRRLVIVARETPLSDIHLRNMLTLTQSGAVIFPPVPAFYIKASSLDEIVDQSVGRMLDLFDLDTGDFERWNGWKNE
jgi:phenylacrylic acid decarboxylase